MRVLKPEVAQDRKDKILNWVVYNYVSTGRPVSSELIAEEGRFSVSSATIRNILKELEETGYLYQAHTSGGRIPSDKGYRAYVDNVLRLQRLAVSEKERLCRGYIQAIWREIGPRQDVPAPDVGTTPQMMGWMMDEYSKLAGEYTPGVITGKPVGGGGSLGRTEATGYGVVYHLREAMKKLKIDPTKCTASLQGYGNVSQYAAIGFTEMLGGKVMAVSYWDRDDRKSYTISHEKSIDPHFLQNITDQYGAIDKEKAKAASYAVEDGSAWLGKDVDVLIPAAIEGQINAETVEMVSSKVRIVAEGANGPTTLEADEQLKKRGVFMIPDFLCNAGGVTVSYFESVQNDMNYYWGREEVLARLDEKMTNAFQNVYDMHEKEGVFMRDAAYMVAINRVVKAMQLRGWV